MAINTPSMPQRSLSKKETSDWAVSYTGTGLLRPEQEGQPVPAETSVHNEVMAVLRNIAPLYEIDRRNWPEIINFLNKHPYLINILIILPDKVQRYFPNAGLRLVMVYDPEDSSFDHLSVYIQTSMGWKAALDVLDRFQYDWWLEQDYKYRSKFVIDLDLG